jgi:hypothetical protein
MRQRLALPVVLVLTALAISACGGSSNHSSASGNRGAAYGGSSASSRITPAAYLKSVCTSLGPVVQDLKSKQAALAALASSNDLAKVKKGLQDFISAASSDVSSVIPQLQSAGTPNVSNGGAVQSGLVKAYTQFKTALDTAGSQAAALPTNDPAAFRTASTSLGTTLRSAIAGIAASTRALKSPQLSAAAKAEPACAALKS